MVVATICSTFKTWGGTTMKVCRVRSRFFFLIVTTRITSFELLVLSICYHYPPFFLLNHHVTACAETAFFFIDIGKQPLQGDFLHKPAQ